MDKNYKIEWAPVAIKDFDEIIEYIIENDSISAGIKIQQKLLKKIDTLTFLPLKHRIPPELKARGLVSIRELIATPYSIFFRVDRTVVGILGVLDRRRDLEEILFKRVLSFITLPK